MSMLPRVTDPTRERISREFDNLGRDVCMADIRKDLDRHNPQLLAMAVKWAGEGKEGKKLFTAFGMFYRLLAAEASALLESDALSPLPQGSSETRDRLLARIPRTGDEQFVREAIGNLEAANPELLQMAHSFASVRPDYAPTMQGFALLYEALLIQSQSDRLKPH